jgi:DNA polymerase-3 subunit gamma/tau
MSETSVPYRVLARKYRPRHFDDLIGQEALVRTLKNAIASGRIAHAFMLTGIRGVGKTTTARIIAKALNYTGADGTSGPTTESTDDCDICRAIAEDRHPDVMEMDAASRTGVDDIREILDGVRYAPTSARYKIYIIDEVHMLSKNAFNALLKTLEEPPAHVKFIFATTEIRKVPVTVLSRCQRFDLRRIEAPVLAEYFQKVCAQEKVSAEESALNIIARAADGSVRDGLSILDQSIALGAGTVTADQVKDMLGLADRTVMIDLFEKSVSGQCESALGVMNDLYRKGADPSVVINDLLDICHALTKFKAAPQLQDSSALLAPDETRRLNELAGRLSMPALGRAWQILLKGVAEVATSPHPQKTSDMVVIRLAYTADLPDPAELIRKLKDAPAVSGVAGQTGYTATSMPSVTAMSSAPTRGALAPAPALAPDIHLNPGTSPHTLSDVVAMLEQSGAMILATQVRMYVHPVKFEMGRIEFYPAEGAPPKLAQELSQQLKAITGSRWMVTVSSQPGAPTLAQEAQSQELQQRDKAMSSTLVKQILDIFPEAELTRIYTKE